MSLLQEKLLLCKTEERPNRIREKLKATCTLTTNKGDAMQKKPIPLIAKPTSDVYVMFGSSPPDAADDCAIPSRLASSPIASSILPDSILSYIKVPVKRPISPPIGPFRGRLPSHSNPSESSAHRNRHNISPSRNDKLKDDIINEQIKIMMKAPLYLIRRPGPHSFLVASDGLEQTYRVTIGQQECSCGKGPHCIHVLFVMLRVFRVSKTDVILRSNTLKNFEVDSLIAKYDERRNKRISHKDKVIKRNFHASTENLSKLAEESVTIPSRPQSMPDIRSSLVSSNNEEEEDHCPICLREMFRHENIVICKAGCKNRLHQECISFWAKECERQQEPVLCPLCRTKWLEGKISSIDDYHLQTSSNKSSLSSTAISPPSSSIPIEDHKQKIPLLDLTSDASSTFYIGSSCSSEQSNLPIPHSPQGLNTKCYKRHLSFHPSQVQYLQKHQGKFEEWGEIFGKEVINDLSSSDWTAREKSLEYLHIEITTALTQFVCDESPMPFIQPKHLSVIISSCCEILAAVALDPVYKVYVACLRCFRGLLACTVCKTEEERLKLRANIKPIVKAIMIKCVDGNRRMNQISMVCLVELCKGLNGEFAVGRHTKHPAQSGIGGVSFLLNCIIETESEPTRESWLWCLGRLYLLDRLMEEFPEDFYLLYVQMYPKEVGYNLSDSCGHKLVHLDRLLTVLNFAVKLITHEHLTVRKMSRRVFILAARLTSHIPPVFLQVCDMLVSIDSGLEMRLKEGICSSNKSFQFPMELLEQVQKSTEDDETIIYTSVREPRRRSSSGRSLNFINFHDRALLLEKLGGPDLPCGGCLYSKHSSWYQSKRTVSLGNERLLRQHSDGDSNCCSSNSRLAKQKDNYSTLRRPTYLPLVGRYQKFPPQINPYDRLEGRSCRPSKPESLWSSSKNLFLSAPTIKHTYSRSNIYNNENRSKHSCCNHTYSSRNLHTNKPVPVPPPPPPNTPSNCPVGDLIDLTPVMTSTPRREETSPASLGNSSVNLLAPIYHQNLSAGEAVIVAKAMEKQLFIQTSLPTIPGLTDMSFEPFDSDEFTVGCNLTQDEKNSELDSYSEGLYWIRGQLLGTGAFSSCYQARDVNTGTLMAVKQVSFCRNTPDEQSNQKMAIREEIIMMAKLDHPNVVRLLGATLQGNHYNMFVEWMPGGSVSALLSRYGPFTEIVILRYLKQILSGLACLHDNQILHRDLKGANLLVDSTGHHLRIGDFGAAARLASQRTVADEFKGQLLGTIAFMAPEVLRGEGYGRSCDVWSVGCVVIEMATTKPPWDAADISNDLALLYKIACSKTHPPIPTTLSDVIRAITLRCLEPKSAKRPAAKELLGDPCFHAVL